MAKPNRNESADSLWDVDFELADQRISARRNRIRQRLDAVKKVQKMIQVKHIFGYTAMAAGEQFPVQVTTTSTITAKTKTIISHTPIPNVVYFDQRLGATISKQW